MKVFNVMFKGEEVKTIPFAKVFATKEESEAYINEKCKKHGLTIKSSLDSGDGDEPLIWSDYRTEDKDGNTYFFVTYYQEIVLPVEDPEVLDIGNVSLN
jgi:hypothetical protein